MSFSSAKGDGTSDGSDKDINVLEGPASSVSGMFCTSGRFEANSSILRPPDDFFEVSNFCKAQLHPQAVFLMISMSFPIKFGTYQFKSPSFVSSALLILHRGQLLPSLSRRAKRTDIAILEPERTAISQLSLVRKSLYRSCLKMRNWFKSTWFSPGIPLNSHYKRAMNTG